LGRQFGVTVLAVVVGGLILLAGAAWWWSGRADTDQSDLQAVEATLSQLQVQLDSLARATTTTAFDLPIPDHDAEVVRVAEVVVGLLGRERSVDWRSAVDDPTGMDATMASLATNPCNSGSDVQVQSIAVVAPDRAHVVVQLRGPSFGPIPFELDVVKRPSGWKVDHRALVALADLARGCPLSGSPGPVPTTAVPR
jgi:hypothetical protein